MSFGIRPSSRSRAGIEDERAIAAAATAPRRHAVLRVEAARLAGGGGRAAGAGDQGAERAGLALALGDAPLKARLVAGELIERALHAKRARLRDALVEREARAVDALPLRPGDHVHHRGIAHAGAARRGDREAPRGDEIGLPALLRGGELALGDDLARLVLGLLRLELHARRGAIAGEARHAPGVDLGERRDPGARADQDGGRGAH
jgi:hypothetical protein